MATLRQFKSFSWTNPNFFGLIIAILLLYIIYIYFYIVLHNATALGHVIAIVAVNFFFFFTIWCFIATVIVEPGHVPQYWGLYTEEMPKNTERTYCLICHNFKPERCHHCSSCQQCVLNMDHHCPWVNNCIGYFNRKYFLLFLMYAVLALLILSVQEAWLLVMSVLNGYYAKEPVMTVIRILGLLGGVALEVSLTTFYFFHMKLVFRNTTTLEMMILERKKYNWRNGRSTYLPQTENIYDVGTYANFKQVYGRNLCYWLLPIVDDDRIYFGGIRWPFKTQSIKTETTGSPQNNGANGNNSKFSRAMTLTNREYLDRE